MNNESNSFLDENVEPTAPLWKPLDRIERRVVGVLVEKAKTTPDAYPLTLNSIRTAANQKSNRSPKMDLDEDDILLALDNLRDVGAVTEVQSAGRVAKYRHKMYEWLGVDKYELAVVTELLLRGQQTLGELRGRAARMESIADISALRPIVQSLMQKGLMVAITPEGRGQIVDHGMYPENEKPAAIEQSAISTAEPIESAAQEPAANPSEIELLKNKINELETRLARIEGLLEN